MLVIPAVDIRNGKAVRLIQGRADREIVYDDDPVAAARRWVEAGARRIHVVDLDGAFSGEPKNAPLVLRIIQTFASSTPPSQAGGRRLEEGLPARRGVESLSSLRPPASGLQPVEIEASGGLRTGESVAQFIEAGAARCVIGTRAAEDRAFLEALARRYPGRINLGLDARGGQVVTRGWVETHALRATEFLRGLTGLPLAEVIYTDVERDGMLEGPNFARLAEVRSASPFPVIASGGVTTLADVRRLREMGCFGCIIGKALFDGRLDLKAALAAGAEGNKLTLDN